MKVNIDKTLEVTDEQRKEIAAVLDGEGAKRRDATRDEMKEFIWTHGANWENVLIGSDVDDQSEPDEDLIGGDDSDDDEDLESLI